MRLTWPVRPYNPYRNAPETGIEHAVGALTTELEAKPQLVTFAFRGIDHCCVAVAAW
jgi:hypothetical protein